MPGTMGRIDERVMIPELLRAAPEVRPVLDRYGLRGCGGPEGPAAPPRATSAGTEDATTTR